MTKYVAKCCIGFTRCSHATFGETLDESQVAALGEERIAEMVKRGELSVINEPDLTTPASAKCDAQGTPTAETKMEESSSEETIDEDDDSEETLDETAMDGLVTEAPETAEPEHPASKTRGKKK